MKRALLISLLWLLLLLMGCVHIRHREESLLPVETETIIDLSVTYNADKTIYSPLDNTIYIMDVKSNHIRIYQDKRQLNSIGGLGFNQDNFNRLSDIAISPNGKLLALDSLQKSIKFFDSKGMYLEEHKLTGTAEPFLFDTGIDGTLFVYDRTTNEIIIIDNSLKEEIHRFGKFKFLQPTQLVFNNRQLIVNDSGKTHIFSSLGNLMRSIDGQIQVDRYGNHYKISGNSIEHIDSGKKFFTGLNIWQSMLIKGNIMILKADNKIRAGEIIYEKR